MTKTKLNIIKLNIITAILTLIYISCTVNKIDLKPKSKTNPKEKTQNLFQESKDLAPSNQEPKDLKPLNQEPQTLKPLKKESLETIISKLKEIAKKLETQKEQEDQEIAKIATEKFDFLNTFTIGPYDIVEERAQTQIKRIIYSSLNYEKEKIKTLEEILEKLKKNRQNQIIATRFIHHTSWGIQSNLENDLKSIKKATEDNIHTLSKEAAKKILIEVESNLELKQGFAKKINETLKAYNQDSQNIKTNDEELAKNIDENYKNSDSLKPIN
ncbi:outer surface protein (plasmid) [Borreliella afzelii PKo]|uniref:Outer surface protein n=1 Tax=Borreliella afzelii (strain PKo) TaxID=390236 RepID=Q0SLU0_BORAP|nr:hypothetical protein BAPKO_2066 [Borreliella afzelii PKo]AEL70684.1 outer surface protein [Borreliella afzelii PKo]